MAVTRGTEGNEVTDRPKWDGNFSETRHIAVDILAAHSDDPDTLVEKIAEALMEAFNDGVLAEYNAGFTDYLHDYGIGIATLEEMKARTLAIARGELEPSPSEPKLWFASIESMVESLRTIGGDYDDGDVELYEECVRAKRPMSEKE